MSNNLILIGTIIIPCCYIEIKGQVAGSTTNLTSLAIFVINVLWIEKL